MLDWVLAIVLVPLVATFNTIGGVGSVDGSDRLARRDPPSLIFRLLPEMLPDDDELAGVVLIYEAVFHHVWFGVLLTIVLPLLVGWTIILRRSHPVPLLVLAIAMQLLLGTFVPIVVGLYSYTAWFTDRRKLVAWAVAAIAAIVVGSGEAEATWDTLRSAIAITVVTVVAPISLGLWTGTRRQLLASLRERADRLEREQALMAERAATAERNRIAREMHDVVAHRVSLMVVHAGALEVSGGDETVVDTAGQIRAAGREALGELREVLGVLRDDADIAPTAPQPTLADVDRLVDGWRSTGMDLQVGHDGDVRPLPGLTERTAYRVIQEGLTNVAKHAPGTSVQVHLHYGKDALIVTVTNGRAAVTDQADPPTGGLGLTGLRERVGLARGELTSGRRDDGTWQVRATLPVTEDSQ